MRTERLGARLKRVAPFYIPTKSILSLNDAIKASTIICTECIVHSCAYVCSYGIMTAYIRIDHDTQNNNSTHTIRVA